MDESIKESLAGFESLWQRVSCSDGDGAPPAGQDAYSLEDALLGLIHDETCAVVWTTALARTCRGERRAILQRHASQARRHLRRLRAEHFLVTGAPAGTNQDCRDPGGDLSALRTLFFQAQDLAERYEAAADRAGEGQPLREALLAFAVDERRRARETRALLIECF